MKPCESQIESIALMAAGEVLPDPRASELQSHLARCTGCRLYAEQMTRLCGEHREAAGIHRQNGAELDSAILRRVASEIRDRPRTSRWLRPQFAALAVFIAFAGAWAWLQMDPIKSPAGTPLVQQPRPNPSGQPETTFTEPSLQSYRRAFARSPQVLEEMLASEAVALHTTGETPAHSGELLTFSHRE